jgi:hypothetical protein
MCLKPSNFVLNPSRLRRNTTPPSQLRSSSNSVLLQTLPFPTHCPNFTLLAHPNLNPPYSPIFPILIPPYPPSPPNVRVINSNFKSTLVQFSTPCGLANNPCYEYLTLHFPPSIIAALVGSGEIFPRVHLA